MNTPEQLRSSSLRSWPESFAGGPHQRFTLDQFRYWHRSSPASGFLGATAAGPLVSSAGAVRRRRGS